METPVIYFIDCALIGLAAGIASCFAFYWKVISPMHRRDRINQYQLGMRDGREFASKFWRSNGRPIELRERL